MKEITVDELARRLESGEHLTILDIREANEFDDWRIHNSLNIPMYNAINAGQDTVVDEASGKLTNDKPVVTVCRMGNTSQVAASRLEALGFDAFSLKGGIHDWTNAWSVASIDADGPFELIQIRRNGKGCLAYILASDGQAAVVDPCVDAAVFVSLAEKRGLRISHVLETHVHADHISRARQLCKETGATLYVPQNQRAQFEFEPLTDGQEIRVGSAKITVIATPGHTLESVCFEVDGKVLLSGDTIFIENIGRPDLEKGDAGAEAGARLLYQSLHEKVLKLSDNMLVCPGHTSDPIAFDGQALASPLSEVRKRIGDFVTAPKNDFVKTIIDNLGAKPPNFERVLAVNEGRADLGWLDPLDLEAGPNRCAVRKG